MTIIVGAKGKLYADGRVTRRANKQVIDDSRCKIKIPLWRDMVKIMSGDKEVKVRAVAYGGVVQFIDFVNFEFPALCKLMGGEGCLFPGQTLKIPNLVVGLMNAVRSSSDMCTVNCLLEDGKYVRIEVHPDRIKVGTVEDSLYAGCGGGIVESLTTGLGFTVEEAFDVVIHGNLSKYCGGSITTYDVKTDTITIRTPKMTKTKHQRLVKRFGEGIGPVEA